MQTMESAGFFYFNICTRHLNPTKFNSNYNEVFLLNLVFPFILTDFDRFTTVFSSVRTRTFSLFLFFTSEVQMKSSHHWNGKLINCRKKIEKIDWHISVPNLILYKVMPVKIRDNFAQQT